MSGWQFSFPPSRTCLWDATPTDSPCELYITRNSWLHIRISTATLHLALRHAKQSRRKLFECFLIATAWITDGEGIAVEVDRFDPGRPSSDGSGLSPTTLIPGDIIIPSTLVESHPHAKHLTHNMESLHRSIATVKHSLTSHNTPLDPSLLLSLKIHCTYSENDHVSLECACVYPGLIIEATPIQPIPIVQTALARNLSGPLSLSAIQGKAKHGFVTMEAARKLVLLLHSDPKAATLPLVGVWVSGVSSVYHPVVWMACAVYSQSCSLTDRVWGEERSFLVLVYLQGSTRPRFSQCVLKNDGNWVQLASGESSLSQVSSTAALISFELYPVQESTALHTLLETAVTPSSGSTFTPQQTRLSCDLMPLPSPQPTPAQVPPQLSRDSELSMVSCLSLSEETQSSVSLTPQTTSDSQGQDNKENTPTDSEWNEGAPSNQSVTSQAEDSLIVFPDKMSVKMTPRSADTRRLLKQQEVQLRALQEQVNSLLQAQSPQSLNITPTVEASTSTGESLYWPHPPSTQAHFTPAHSTPSQPSLFTPAPDSAHSTPSRLEQDESVCSSVVSGVSLETVTSVLSHNVSDMHLDLHSYAQSPSPPSFGDSASVVAVDDPLLVSDPQQVYQNMLTTVNALLRSQEDESPPNDSISAVSHVSTEHSVNGLEQRDVDTSHSSTTLSQSVSQSSSNSSDEPSTETLNNESSSHSNASTQVLHKSSDTLSHYDSTGQLPYLHPDVRGQLYGSSEVSLLPVPRIIGPVLSSNTTLDTAAVYGRAMMNTDSTLDENMQLADMIAMKYLGHGKAPVEGQDHPRQALMSGDVEDVSALTGTDSAHMSLATRQYLQRHRLLASDEGKPSHSSVPSKEAPPASCTQDPQDNILNIRRLKQLPKLI